MQHTIKFWIDKILLLSCLLLISIVSEFHYLYSKVSICNLIVSTCSKLFKQFYFKAIRKIVLKLFYLVLKKLELFVIVHQSGNYFDKSTAICKKLNQKFCSLFEIACPKFFFFQNCNCNCFKLFYTKQYLLRILKQIVIEIKLFRNQFEKLF